MKKISPLKGILIGFLFFSTLSSFAQLGKNKDKDKQENTESSGSKKLERPAASGGSQIDNYATTAFNAYDEMNKISEEMLFYQVSIKEIPDDGSGVTTEATITNGKGEKVDKATALKQFGDLLVRVLKQSENIARLIELQKPAAQELATITPFAKAKASKAMTKAGEAQAFVVAEVKKQGELLNQQISSLKAAKSN